MPPALVGWLHWWLPTRLVAALAARALDPRKRKAQAAPARMLTGLVIYSAAFSFYVTCAYRRTLPPGGPPARGGSGSSA